MGKLAHINFEDMPNGTVAMQVMFPGGFDHQSGAHQAAQIMIKRMDEVCVQKTEPHEEVIGGGVDAQGEDVTGVFTAEGPIPAGSPGLILLPGGQSTH